MTREEAIRRIVFCRDYLVNTYTDMGEPNFTAFNMAIKALEQEPCEDCEYKKRLKEEIELKSGHWIEDENEMKVRCSECGDENDKCSMYCPNCGAEMEREE